MKNKILRVAIVAQIATQTELSWLDEDFFNNSEYNPTEVNQYINDNCSAEEIKKLINVSRILVSLVRDINITINKNAYNFLAYMSEQDYNFKLPTWN